VSSFNFSYKQII